MYNKILVPTDGSDLSAMAVTAAIDFARSNGAEIVAFSAAEPYPVMPMVEGAMVLDPGVDTEVLLNIARANVEKVALIAEEAGVPCATATAFAVPAYEAIIKAATDHRCDLIFMASHGRHGLSKLLAGSVTQDVLAYSSLPVLVLRPPKPSAAATADARSS
jgi:nucleotide-binding universal stress UspA family protein